MSMKKIALIFALLSLSVGVFARPAVNKPVVYTQPDGSTITVLLRGDERAHWMTDMDGNHLGVGVDGFIRPVSREESIVRTHLQRSAAAAGAARKAASPVQPARRFPTRTDNFGTKRALVIMVNFSNLSFKNSADDLSSMLNEEGYSVNNGTGSVRDFYIDNSHGLFTPEFDVYGPYKVDSRYNSFGDGTSNTEDAFFQACKLAEDDVDFSKYDSDGDGIVDFIAFFYAGYNQAEGGAYGTIWPHQWNMQWAGGSYASTKFDGVKLGNYFCTSEFYGSTGSKLCTIGTTCHEFAHALGLPDLYDSDYDTNGSSCAMVNFSSMCSGADLNDGRTPVYFTVFERIMLGWVDEDEALVPFAEEGIVNIPPVYEDRCYLSSTTASGEFFLYEYRDGTKYDKYLPKGMVVYHIDQSSRKVTIENAYGNKVQVSASELWSDWISTNAINESGSHPCCYAVCAADPDDLLHGFTYFPSYGGYYLTGNDAEYVFPCKYAGTTINSYVAKDWNGQYSSFRLSNIACSTGAVSMKVSFFDDSEQQLPDLGYNYIVPPLSSRAGESMTLMVHEGGKASITKTVWFVDGARADGEAITLTGREQKITASLTLSDGSSETIELVVNPR